MIYWMLVIVHVIACLVLIGVILLQSGRGGGLSEMAGGSGVQQTQKLFGTQTNALLMKFTSYCAIVFLITSVSLVLLTSRRSRSLMEDARIQPIFNTQETAADGKVLDKKTLEEAVKALAEQAKKGQADAGKAASTSATAVTTAAESGAKALEAVQNAVETVAKTESAAATAVAAPEAPAAPAQADAPKP